MQFIYHTQLATNADLFVFQNLKHKVHLNVQGAYNFVKLAQIC